MAECCGNAMTRAITGDSLGMDVKDFGRGLHEAAVSIAIVTGQ
jgi:hypothetical protein